MKRTPLLLISFFILGVFLPAAALALPSDGAIDGNLSDWGLNPSASGQDWEPEEGVVGVVENSTQSFVDPGWGGQPFDAEGMYAYYSDDNGGTLYVAIVTGTPPAGTWYGGQNYAPGDLAIDFNSDGTYEFGVETTGREGAPPQGTIVSMDEGDWGESSDFSPESDPFNIEGGTDSGYDGQLAYNNTYYSGTGYGNHYVIETAIPVEAFGDLWGTDFTLHWTMECGNDVIELAYSAPVPEPASALLLGAGLIGIIAARKRSIFTARI